VAPSVRAAVLQRRAIAGCIALGIAAVAPVASAEPVDAVTTALVEEAGTVLPDRAIQLQPGAMYTQSKIGTARRDTLIPALTVRAGLPWATQVELQVPYVYAQQTRREQVSGIGDVQLGLANRLLAEGPYWPELAAGVLWKSATGDAATRPPTGTGVDTLRGAVSAIIRPQPFALFATLDYTAGLEERGRARPHHAGGRVGASAAVSPETAVYLDVSATSPARGFVRPTGVAQIGMVTGLSPTTAFDIAVGVGVTRRAPRFQLTVSVPISL
jgi:hypothetical protein